MRDIQERRVLQRLAGSWTVFLVLLVIGGWLAAGARKAYKEAREARAGREKMEAQTARLEARDKELENKLEGFSRGEGIEEEARETLFLKKPEEEVVIIVE
jgi:cell division protein FtsB